jgi:hypothetical protein
LSLFYPLTGKNARKTVLLILTEKKNGDMGEWTKPLELVYNRPKVLLPGMEPGLAQPL